MTILVPPEVAERAGKLADADAEFVAFYRETWRYPAAVVVQGTIRAEAAEYQARQEAKQARRVATPTQKRRRR